MSDADRSGYIEAGRIIEQALGAVVTESIEWGDTLDSHLVAEDVLFRALAYVDRQRGEGEG